MKRFLFTLTLLLCCMTEVWAGDGDGTPENPDADLNDTPEKAFVEVSDGETFKRTIQQDNAARILLMANINLGGLANPLCAQFQGEIDGQGHTISGSKSWLFDTMDKATIANVIFKDFHVYTDSENEQKLGGIAKSADGCTFHDITLDNFYVESNIDVSDEKELSSRFGVGGFVGVLDSGDVENVIVKNSTIINFDNRTGGIAGKSSNTHFVRCEVDDQTGVFGDGILNAAGVDKSGISSVGGIVGVLSNCVLNECINSAFVGGDWDRIGGIAGSSSGYIGSSDDVILDCINTGIVTGIDYDDFGPLLEKYRKHQLPKSELTYNGRKYIVQSLGDDDGKATSDRFVGGIVGFLSESSIKQCSNYGAVYGGQSTGGILGQGSGYVYNCLSAGPVSSGSWRGSIVGYDEYWCTIRNCLAVADDRPMCDGHFDDVRSHAFGHQSNFSLKDSNRDESWDSEKTVTSKEMRSGLVARYLNQFNTTGVTPWRQNLTAHDGMAVDLYPTLDPSHDEVTFESMASRTAISTPEQLIAFAKQVNEGDKNQFACAHLEADIDMHGYDWTPIGSNASYSQYRGCFDGRGHTISNLEVTSSGPAGLFGVAHVGAEIRNLIIGKGSEITCNGDAGAGAILGQVNVNWNWGHVRIENCGSYATINANKHGGGILGKVETENGNQVCVFVNNCFNMGNIIAAHGNSGLLCGYTKNHGHISNCWSDGLLRTTTNETPYSTENDDGVNEYLAGYDKTIELENCYAYLSNFYVDLYDDKIQNGVTPLTLDLITCGELVYRLNGNTNDVSQPLRWEQNLLVDKYPVWGNKGVYHAREIHKDKYGTICVPYDIKSDVHVTYFTFVSDEIEDGALKLNFEYADTVPAGKPALFLSADDMTYDFPGIDGITDLPSPTNSQTPGSEWQFVGYFNPISLTDEGDEKFTHNIYYLSDNTIRHTNKVTIPEFRAFFFGPTIDDLRESLGNPSAAHVRIVIDGEENEVAALQLVTDDSLSTVEGRGEAYTLFGTKAGKGYRGIVVHGGKLRVNN